jgi:F-type H+-transporting ATPase subunit b
LKDGRHRTLGALAPLAAVLVLAAPASAAEGGIQILPDWGLMFVLVIAFALLIAPVNALLITPLLRVLDERRERIEGARTRARAVEEDAERVLGSYEAALAQARRDAASERQRRIEETRGEEKAASASAHEAAEGQIERARASIESALGEARATLRQEAQALAREAAERILGRRLS